MSSTGTTAANTANTARADRGQSERHRASDPNITVGNIMPPAPKNNGIVPTHPATRATVVCRRERSRRRLARTLAWASPNTANAPTMNNVPPHENSGLVDTHRIHTRATTPPTAPPIRPIGYAWNRPHDVTSTGRSAGIVVDSNQDRAIGFDHQSQAGSATPPSHPGPG